MITVALARTVHLPLICAVALTQPKSGVRVEEKISWDERLQADVIYLLNRNDGLPPVKKCRYGGFDSNFKDTPGFLNNHRLRIATEGGIFIIPSVIDDGSISYLRDVLRNVIQTDMFAAQMMGFRLRRVQRRVFFARLFGRIQQKVPTHRGFFVIILYS